MLRYVFEYGSQAAPIVFPTRLVFPTSMWVARGTNRVPDRIGVPHIHVGRRPHTCRDVFAADYGLQTTD